MHIFIHVSDATTDRTPGHSKKHVNVVMTAIHSHARVHVYVHYLLKLLLFLLTSLCCFGEVSVCQPLHDAAHSMVGAQGLLHILRQRGQRILHMNEHAWTPAALALIEGRREGEAGGFHKAGGHWGDRRGNLTEEIAGRVWRFRGGTTLEGGGGGGGVRGAIKGGGCGESEKIVVVNCDWYKDLVAKSKQANTSHAKNSNKAGSTCCRITPSMKSHVLTAYAFCQWTISASRMAKLRQPTIM